MGGENRYYEGNRSDLKAIVPTDAKKVLEVGCADGGFRNYFGECEYWGVECVSEIATEAESRLDHVLTGFFDDVFDQLPDHFFDTVICNDVIEHMPDHDDFLQKIKQKMTLDGKIFASIPNVRYVENLKELIFKKDWAYRDEGILDRTHLRFFTKKSLRRVLEEHRYEIHFLEGVNSALPKKWYRIGRRSLMRRLLVSILGSDTQYRQFCVIASLK